MKEKEYVEAEVIKDSDKKNNFENNFGGDMEGQINMVKNAILMKGLSALILPILIFVLILSGIISLLMWLIPTPFDYIVSAIVLFFILSPVYKIIKMFK